MMIVLIVTLCVTVMMLSVTLPINIYLNEEAGVEGDEWSSDFLVTVKTSSKSRLLFEDDAIAALGDNADVIGEFSLTGFTPENDDGEKTQTQIGAFELARADSFFEIRYIEYGKFTNNNIDRSAIVGESFADGLGLSLGDTVTVNVLGERISYTVQAIAKDTGIFKTKEMIVDISSIRRILAERSAVIASLSSHISPYTRMHIKVKEGISTDAFKADTEGNAYLADKDLVTATDTVNSNYYSTILPVTVIIPGALLIIVSAMMMVSTFDLLQKKRRGDIALFRTVGADPGQLNRLRYLESLIYGIVGGAFGCILFVPVAEWLNALYSFKHVRMSFGAFEVLIGLGSAIVFTSVCTLLHIRKQKKASLDDDLASEILDTDRHFSPKKLALTVPIAAVAALSLLVAPIYRYPFAGTMLVLSVILIYVISPYAIGGAAWLISLILDRRGRGFGKLILATRSCRNSYPLRHAGRIMTMLLTMLVAMTTVINVVDEQMEGYVGFAKFDYVGMYVDDETRELVEELDGVVDVTTCMVNRNVVFMGTKSVTGIAVEDYSPHCFSDTIYPEAVPKGNRIALSKGVADMLGAKVGDKVVCTVSDVEHTFVLSEIVNVHADFAYYDAEYTDSALDMTCIRTDGTGEAAERVISLFDERGIQCLQKDEFFSATYDRVNPQLVVFEAMLALMIFMTVIGIMNILSEQRMAREREFEIIKQNGMTEKGIIALQVTEVLCLLITAVAMAAVFSVAITSIINMIATSFGLTIYA